MKMQQGHNIDRPEQWQMQNPDETEIQTSRTPITHNPDKSNFNLHYLLFKLKVQKYILKLFTKSSVRSFSVQRILEILLS